MLRIITLNLNGIRSALRKGFPSWLARQRADIVCLQEIKAQEADLADLALVPRGFHGHYHCAARRGYSGVALYSRVEPEKVICGFGSREFDAEGRFLRADFGRLSVVSVYLPSGSSGEDRQRAKFRFLDEFLPVLERLRRSRNWRSNRKNSGFLPEEREWLTGVFDRKGWVDVFRRLDPRPEQYTWWSTRGRAWAKNVGWRIDYQVATAGIAARATKAAIYKARRFSDHAPLIIDYDWSLGAVGD
jgi:exodeoxyribonuclease-3